MEMVLERRRGDVALATSERRFRSIFESVSEAILISDGSTRQVIEANPPARKLFDLSPQGRGAPVLESVIAGDPPYTREAALGHLAQLRPDGEPLQFEWQSKERDGRPFWTDNIARLIKLGQQSAILMTARDTSDAKEFQDQLRHAQKMEAIGQLTGRYRARLQQPAGRDPLNLELAVEHAAGNAVVREPWWAARGRGQWRRRAHPAPAGFSRAAAGAKLAFLPPLLESISELLRRTLGENIRLVSTSRRQSGRRI